MIAISDEKVILRDFIESDIEKRIYWETIETEWQLWDAPWEYENLTKEEEEKNLTRYITKMRSWINKFDTMPDEEKRLGFQICTIDNVYIGWCNSYTIDDNFCYSESGTRCAIGIDIPETSQRGNGYAFHALCLFVDYLLKGGESEIYIQTWSGNERMISLADKLGFEECHRKNGIRSIRGRTYDGLSFRLNIEKYNLSKCTR
jgi:RimJ/RimL family protein N-acetyltransferase